MCIKKSETVSREDIQINSGEVISGAGLPYFSLIIINMSLNVDFFFYHQEGPQDSIKRGILLLIIRVY